MTQLAPRALLPYSWSKQNWHKNDTLPGHLGALDRNREIPRLVGTVWKDLHTETCHCPVSCYALEIKGLLGKLNGSSFPESTFYKHVCKIINSIPLHFFSD